MRLLIILLVFISSLAKAQDVIIPANVARYFLEQHDRAKILAEKDSVNRRIICGVNDELKIKQSVIESYKKDSLDFRTIIYNKELETLTVREELLATQKLVDSKRFEVSLFAGAAGGAIVGSAIPAIGTVGGAVVGGLTGCVIYGVGKIKQLFKTKVK